MTEEIPMIVQRLLLVLSEYWNTRRMAKRNKNRKWMEKIVFQLGTHNEKSANNFLAKCVLEATFESAGHNKPGQCST